MNQKLTVSQMLTVRCSFRVWLLLDWKNRLVKIVVDVEKKDKVD